VDQARCLVQPNTGIRLQTTNDGQRDEASETSVGPRAGAFPRPGPRKPQSGMKEGVFTSEASEANVGTRAGAFARPGPRNPQSGMKEGVSTSSEPVN